jgi:hypothetical protein
LGSSCCCCFGFWGVGPAGLKCGMGDKGLRGVSCEDGSCGVYEVVGGVVERLEGVSAVKVDCRLWRFIMVIT